MKRAPGQAWQSHVVEPLESENGDRQRRERFAGSKAKQCSGKGSSRLIRKTLPGRGAIARSKATRALGEARAAYDVEGRDPGKRDRERRERASGATGK